MPITCGHVRFVVINFSTGHMTSARQNNKTIESWIENEQNGRLDVGTRHARRCEALSERKPRKCCTAQCSLWPAQNRPTTGQPSGRVDWMMNAGRLKPAERRDKRRAVAEFAVANGAMMLTATYADGIPGHPGRLPNLH